MGAEEEETPDRGIRRVKTKMPMEVSGKIGGRGSTRKLWKAK